MENEIKIIGDIYNLGVYCYKNSEDGKVLYVGSGMMNDREQFHRYKLKKQQYQDNNKSILQDLYNKGDGSLIFEVLHISANNSAYINGTKEEKAAIQKALEVMEQFYYDMYRDTCCNKITVIKKYITSNPEARSKANRGVKNPNNKYSENLISAVLYLKSNDIKVKDIQEIIKCKFDIELKLPYVYAIGVTKWLSTNAKHYKWIDAYL
jgi:hypothetical protein